MKVPFACQLMNISDSPTEEKFEDLTIKMNKQQMTAKNTNSPMFPLNFRKYLKQSS